MYQELKKKYLVKNLIWAVLAFIIGGIILITQMDNIKMILAPSVNLNTLYADEITEGMKVKVEVGAIPGAYAQGQKDGRVVESEYIIPVGEMEYMGLLLGKSYLDRAERNMEATWDYYEGDDSAIDRIEKFTVTGKVVAMSGDSKEYYEEFMVMQGLEPEQEELFIPYMVVTGSEAGGFTGDFIFFGIVAALSLIIGIYLLIRGLTGGALKNIKKYCEATGNAEAAMQRLERFYEQTQPVGNLRISPEFIMVQTSGSVLVNDASKILWAYQHIVRHYTNGIPTGKDYSIIVWMTDGTKMDIPMKGKKKTEETLDHIGRTLPYIFFGFDEQLQAAYNQNRQGMIQAMTERRAQLVGQMPEEQAMPENANQGV